MSTYRIETVIPKDKTLSVKDLPFAVGDKVEVLVHSRKSDQQPSERYPLRGQPYRYINPFDSVADGD